MLKRDTNSFSLETCTLLMSTNQMDGVVVDAGVCQNSYISKKGFIAKTFVYLKL
jgi:hypothetical protein